jgi:hypothetical protein
MNRYLIEAPHSASNCLLLLDELSASGYLHNFDWGCDDGVHQGWAIVEAESKEEALMAVPLVNRGSARATRLIKYTLEKLKELHLEQD